MIGRKDELKWLKAAYDSPESEFASDWVLQLPL